MFGTRSDSIGILQPVVLGSSFYEEPLSSKRRFRKKVFGVNRARSFVLIGRRNGIFSDSRRYKKQRERRGQGAHEKWLDRESSNLNRHLLDCFEESLTIDRRTGFKQRIHFHSAGREWDLSPIHSDS